MRLVCPHCDTEYEVPTEAASAARFRCVACGQAFSRAAPAPMAASGPMAVERGTRGGGSRDAAILAAWLVSFSLVAGGVWAGLHWREAVMKAWPASARVYTAIGLPPKG